MNLLLFKKTTHEPGMGPQTVEVACRQSYCVPRPGEFVCLDQDDASYIVLRVEYILTPHESEVWVWVS